MTDEKRDTLPHVHRNAIPPEPKRDYQGYSGMKQLAADMRERWSATHDDPDWWRQTKRVLFQGALLLEEEAETIVQEFSRLRETQPDLDGYTSEEVALWDRYFGMYLATYDAQSAASIADQCIEVRRKRGIR